MVLTCAASFAQQAVTIDEAVNQAGSYLISALPRNSQVLIVNMQSDTQKTSEYIMGRLTGQLVNSRSLIVVDREKLDTIRQEEQFQMSGEVSDSTAQRIGHKLGAQTIVLGSFMQIGSQYQLRVRAIAVETAHYQGDLTISVKPDRVLRGLEQEPGAGGNTAWGGLHDPKRLYLGGRAGLSLGFYGNGGGLADKSIYPSQTISGKPAFDAALYASVSIWSLFAAQMEATVTQDSFDLSSGNTLLMAVSYRSLMVPLLAKLVYRPSIFTVQAFAGPYLSLPLGQMEVRHRNGSYSADFPLVPGIMAGGGFGVKLGPGSIMADVRYAADFRNVSAAYNGARDVSRRSKALFALGYEIGLIPK